MKNAWLNHVRQLRKQNRNMSYKSLLQKARQSYRGGGEGEAPAGPAGPVVAAAPASSLQNALNVLTRRGGSYQGMESRSSLTRSASAVGGRRSRRHTRRRRR